MGSDKGWGHPADNYYGGLCRRCRDHRGSPKGECTTQAVAYLQHLMDTQDAPGGTSVTARDLFTLLQLMEKERKAMEAKIDKMAITLGNLTRIAHVPS